MAATTGTAGFGTLLKMNTGSGLTAIAEVTDISGPEIAAGTIEMTHMESPGSSATMMAAREFIGGLLDNGELNFEINFLPANAGQVALATRCGLKAATPFSVTFPNTAATVFAFSAFITKFSPHAPTDDKLSASITLKVTGVVTIT